MNMDSDKIIKEINGTLEQLSKDSPEQTRAFMSLMGAVEKEGALPGKTKELIAISLSVVQKCEYCIVFHVKNALDAGCTEEEILEATWVAVLMGGGPALMYGQKVMQALKDFKK